MVEKCLPVFRKIRIFATVHRERLCGVSRASCQHAGQRSAQAKSSVVVDERSAITRDTIKCGKAMADIVLAEAGHGISLCQCYPHLLHRCNFSPKVLVLKQELSCKFQKHHKPNIQD